MSPVIHASPEVVELVGPEQLARMRGPAWAQRVQCWRCGRWIEADEDRALSVVRVVDPAAAPGTGGISHAIQSHPSCVSSLVLDATPEQWRELQTAWSDTGDDAPGGTADLDVLATIGGTAERPYAVVFLSYRDEITVERPGRDRVDLLASTYLHAGWRPVLTLAAPPGPAPTGYRVRFRHTDPADDAPGLLEIVNPDGEVDTAAVVVPLELWRPLARHHGWTAVVHGTNYLSDGQEGLDRAVRSGLLVSGRVPVELVGPGNTGEPEGTR